MTAEAQFSGPLVQFGNYLLDEEIARGGMARVYRARLRGLGGFEKPLVVKQILPELARDPELVRMFVEEAKTLVQMSHPHVVPVYELGVVDGVYFLAMEYVEGATLAEILRDGPLAPALVAHVGIQVTDALHYAHRRMGLVHRDVTPRNVIVDRAGHVRLLDFGIAARTDAFDAKEPVFGSPGYMAPEQARGEAPIFASDVFALGAVLFEALSGERAFLRATPSETRAALFDEELPSFEDIAPAPLAAILASTLDRDPGERPPAETLGRRLRGWLAHHHPEGVGAELGARTERPRQRKSVRPPGPATPHVTPRSDPSATVRTLATSPALRPYLREAIEPTLLATPTRATTRIEPPRSDLATQAIRTAPIPGRAILAKTSRRPRVLGATLVLAALLGGIVLAIRPPEPPHAPAPTAIAAPRVADDPPTPTPVEPPPPLAIPERATTTDEPSDPTPARPEREVTVLSINATPWAEVYVDGRSVGVTPKRRLTVPSGARQLELKCPPLGRSVRTDLRAPPGAHLKVIADLGADPPSIHVR